MTSMYLKSLSALGFKSFADKTTLNFERGITGVVGPNGCGKSNVADAIRWVLGEQSAKALRGGGMQDVIFNGTDRRKAMGMAEVSITIGDVDHENMRAAGVDITFNELTVTRRIFKDGGSEYYINKAPARLKDIQQLFMGTGVGRTSYSIMAQGNITRIIQSKPEDRRAVFEEAAGITRFKEQKKEALRKLGHTEQNLLRVEDTIREVKRQIGSLQRQAGKARRYKELMVELQHLECQLARHHFDVLTHDIATRKEDADKAREDFEKASEGVIEAEDGIRHLREALAQLDGKIGEEQHRGMELKAEGEKHQHQIEFSDQRLRELSEQNTTALSEIEQSELRIATARDEHTDVVERLKYSESVFGEKKSAVDERKEALNGIESQMQTDQEALRAAQSEAFSVNQELSRLRNEINALDMRKQGNVVRLEKLSAEKIQLEEERAGLERRLAEFNTNVEEQKLSVEYQRGTIEDRESRAAELRELVTQIGGELDGQLREQAEKRSRLNVLEQLEQSHEGFSEAAQVAMKKSSAVIGSLADRIRVPDEKYVKAVEAALGQQLQLVLTEEPESARQILTDLQNEKLGKASIAALDLSRVRTVETPDGPGEAAGPLVESDDAAQNLVQGLLANTRIVADLAEATKAWRDTSGTFDFVTLEGDILNRFGVFTGGSGSGAAKSASSILSRKNDIADLQSDLEGLQTQIDELSRNKGGHQAELTALQAGLQDAQSELRRHEVSIAAREGEFNALQNSLKNLEQRIDTVVYEIQSLAGQEEEGSGKRNELAEQIGDIEDRERNARERVEELTVIIDQLRTDRDLAQNTLTEAKVDLAAEEQRNASLKRQQGPLEERIEELTTLIARRKEEMGSFLGRKSEAEEAIANAKREIERVEHDRNMVAQQVAELARQRDEQNQQIESRDNALRGERNRLNKLQENRGAIDVDLAEKQMTINGLREKIEQKYQVNIDEIESECLTITYADNGPARVESISPEDLEEHDGSTDWDAVAEQVEGLQKRIDQMGPVNLVAIEEYEETEQRFSFLTEQFEDLTKAKDELMGVIDKINTQTQEMFKTTFEAVRENFRSIFSEIFGGGQADLVLVDKEDVLESGVDIVARPPGKKLQSISLLSGGEQTMTAVALLFSIYEVKPSPFAVLDELDAPLDESNINRFLKIVQRFLDRSQFIIITHNKRTIGVADVLYGVTMQEHGVSKVVSVKFHKEQETEEVRNSARPLVPPPSSGTVNDEEDTPHKRDETIEISTAG